MATRPDPSHLISGYATETLSEPERPDLYAALGDEESFDRLVEEESWQQISSSPGVWHELLEALAEPTLAAGVAPEERRRSVAPKGRQRNLLAVTRARLGRRRVPPAAGRRYASPLWVRSRRRCWRSPWSRAGSSSASPARSPSKRLRAGSPPKAANPGRARARRLRPSSWSSAMAAHRRAPRFRVDAAVVRRRAGRGSGAGS